MASTTSTSTVSVQKQSVSCGSSCSQQRANAARRQSCDTVCSSNSSCFLQRRKPVHPLAAPVRMTIGTRSGGNVVRQRLLSAKAAKLKSVQSQLNDANFHLAELVKENRALRILQNRQDKALKTYEGVDAELPKLIKAHEEEIRVLREKNKASKKTVKEMTEQLKTKDEETNGIRDQLKYLTMLSKDKHLGERQKLKEELEEAKEKLKSSEAEVSLLNRKLMLENKNAKFKISNEFTKFKQCQKELAQALAEIDRLNGSVEVSEKIKIPNRKRFSKLPKRQVASNTSLGSDSTTELVNELMSDESDTKLEPIINRQEKVTPKPNGILKSPSENIKARLSTSNKDSVDYFGTVFNKMSSDESDAASKSQLTKSIYTVSTHNSSGSSRPGSSYKLDAISEKLEHSIQKPINKEMDPLLGDYCVNVVGSVKAMNAIVDNHTSDFLNSNAEAQGILEKLKQTDLIDGKLRQETNKSADDLDVVNKIWYEEYTFRKNNRKSSTDKNGNVSGKDLEVSHEEKKKLLATLRAIDNGESVEKVDDVSTTFRKNSKLMKELFGEGND